MSGIERAAELRQRGCCCSQAVFGAYAESLGMDEGTAQKVATGFCGGLGHSAHICGAVSGAIMVLGLKYGSPTIGEATQKAQVAQFVREFLAQFKAHKGSIMCRDLLGEDISTPAGEKAAREQGLYKKICTPLVQSAAEILEPMLDSESEPP